MPVEKSMRGSVRGVTSSVANQFTSATASWLVRAPRAATRPASASRSRRRARRQQDALVSDRDQRDRAEIREQWRCVAARAHTSDTGRRNRAAARARAALVDQEIADVRASRTLDVSACRAGRRRRAPGGSRFGDLPLRLPAALARSPRRRGGTGRAWRSPSPRRRRPGRSAAPGRRRSSTRRSRASRRREEAQAADAVADRDLVGRLALVARLNQCSIVRPARRGAARARSAQAPSAGLCPCRRRTNSATNGAVSGGSERPCPRARAPGPSGPARRSSSIRLGPDPRGRDRSGRP